ISQRFDVPIMSTKGMTVTAARQLVEALTRVGATTLVARDFDKSGFEILDKFTSNTRRYTYTVQPRVVDLGLRLAQAQALGLQAEPVEYASEVDPRDSLRRCGASDEECDFLVHARRFPYEKWTGERVELNAMTSPQFVQWLEDGLRAAGAGKVVPDEATLAQ